MPPPTTTTGLCEEMVALIETVAIPNNPIDTVPSYVKSIGQSQCQK